MRTSSSELLIELDRSKPRGLRVQVEDQLREAVRGGQLPPGTVLPSSRTLAAELGIAALDVKHEGGRFGLGSFKAIGGAYAVYSALARAIKLATDVWPAAADIIADRDQALTAAARTTTASAA